MYFLCRHNLHLYFLEYVCCFVFPAVEIFGFIVGIFWLKWYVLRYVSRKPLIYIGVAIDYASYMQCQTYMQTQRQWSQYGFELFATEKYHSHITIPHRIINIDLTFPCATSIVYFYFMFFIEVLTIATHCPIKSYCRQTRNIACSLNWTEILSFISMVNTNRTISLAVET